MKKYLILFGLYSFTPVECMQMNDTIQIIRLTLLLKPTLSSHQVKMSRPRLPRFLGDVKVDTLSYDPQENHIFDGFYNALHYHQVTYIDATGKQKRSDFIEYFRSLVTGIETDLKTNKTRVTRKFEEHQQTSFVTSYTIATRPEKL